MTFPATISRTERVLLCLALVVVIIFGIRMAGTVITIVLVALILTLLLYPATRWLRIKGLPAPVAVSVVTVAAALCIVVIVYLTVSSFNVIIADLPQYQNDLAVRLANITAFFSAHGISTGQTLLFNAQPRKHYPGPCVVAHEYWRGSHGCFFHRGDDLLHAA